MLANGWSVFSTPPPNPNKQQQQQQQQKKFLKSNKDRPYPIVLFL